MRADGSDVVRLTDDTWLDDNPAWSPNGELIAYAKTGNDGPRGQPSELVHLMNADGSGQRLLVPYRWMHIDEMQWASVAPYLVASGVDANLYETEVLRHFIGGDRVRRTRKGVQHVGDEPYPYEALGNRWPWTSVMAPFDVLRRRAPDEFPYASNIWMVEWVARDRIQRIRLTDNDRFFDRTPVLSPDGELIAFERYDYDSGVSRIMTMRVDGSDLRELTEGFRPRWSSDGRQILYSAGPTVCDELRHCSYQIAIVDRDGANAHVIGVGDHPEWSPVCTIRGTPDDDVIVGTGDRDFICGGAGDDRIMAGEGNDTVLGGVGDDRLLGEAGDDTLMGEEGFDEVIGGSGRDALGAADGSWGVDQAIGGTEVDLCFLGTNRRPRHHPDCEALTAVMPS